MSQDQDPGDGAPSGRVTPAPSNPVRPQYMTVGSGSTSASAAALMARLDHDSGYGGSISSDLYSNDGRAPSWHPGLTYDVPTPPTSQSPDPLGGSATSDHDRRVLAGHVHQQLYNRNRVALGRAINRTVEVLKGLQKMNAEWPAHYPSPTERPPSRPGVSHTQSSMAMVRSRGPAAPAPRPGPRRAQTTNEDNAAESSSAAPPAPDAETVPEPLITPQAAHDFSILTLDLKLQGLTASEIAHSMDRRAVAALLDGRIGRSVTHLRRLRDRIEDTASKVLVTGDLNAGKSTFCNALLRRKLLPEDQQPCTSIFCEVLDARDNGGVEEVHAVPVGGAYDRNDERTYDVYGLRELEKIVVDNERYMQCKVYIKDSRSIDQSLLNNGVVDIALIDAPGLNSDSLQTTAVFARQEEIDVVVFVVSAANHFTLSAKEFIMNAAHEKAYIFIVVNGFDNIRDQERCQQMILSQVHALSPRTFKESSELVHFVSSNAIPVAPANPAGGPPGGGGSSGGSGSGGYGDNDPSPYDEEDPASGPKKHGQPDPKGKGKEKEKLEDFSHLETSLRRFVLEKRARSKLAPARTYLLNVLADLQRLATLNRDIAQDELARVTRELEELEPACERSQRARAEVVEEVDRTIDATCDAVYQGTRAALEAAIARVADQDLGVEYPGLWHAFEYAEDVKAAILEQIAAAVTACEDEARQRAVEGVGGFKGLAMRHLGDEYQELTFRSDLMFRRKKDVLARQVAAPIEVWDFVDVQGVWERQEKVAGTGMALTVVGVMGGRMIGGVGWVDGALGAARILGTRNLRHMIVPGLIATGEPSLPCPLPMGTAALIRSSQSASAPPTSCTPSRRPCRTASRGASPPPWRSSTTRTRTAPASPAKWPRCCATRPTACASACSAPSSSWWRAARRRARPAPRAPSPASTSETWCARAPRCAARWKAWTWRARHRA